MLFMVVCPFPWCIMSMPHYTTCCDASEWVGGWGDYAQIACLLCSNPLSTGLWCLQAYLMTCTQYMEAMNVTCRIIVIVRILMNRSGLDSDKPRVNHFKSWNGIYCLFALLEPIIYWVVMQAGLFVDLYPVHGGHECYWWNSNCQDFDAMVNN